MTAAAPRPRGNALAATLISMAGQPNVITIYRAFVDFTGDLPTALALSQMLFWSQHAGPDGWFYRSDRAWQDDLCLSRHAFRRAVERLRRAGVLATAVRRAGGSPTLHYQLDAERLMALWTPWVTGDQGAPHPAFQSADPSDCLDSDNGLSESRQSTVRIQTNMNRHDPDRDSDSPAAHAPPEDGPGVRDDAGAAGMVVNPDHTAPPDPPAEAREREAMVENRDDSLAQQPLLGMLTVLPGGKARRASPSGPAVRAPALSTRLQQAAERVIEEHGVVVNRKDVGPALKRLVELGATEAEVASAVAAKLAEYPIRVFWMRDLDTVVATHRGRQRVQAGSLAERTAGNTPQAVAAQAAAALAERRRGRDDDAWD